MWNNPRAHDYVRLYFRPKNQFHLKTEGIKPNNDPHRQDPHMSMPIMLVFDRMSVLTSSDARFVSGNFAALGATPETGDENFDQLDFSKIYHDSPHHNPAIHEARMSEVVLEGNLSLDHLKAVFCRTIYEEQTLRHQLRNFQNLPLIKTEKPGNLFFRRAIFIDEVYKKDRALYFAFRAPSTAQKPEYQVRIMTDGHERSYSLPDGKWKVDDIISDDPDAVLDIQIEGCLAFRATLPNSDIGVI